MSAVNIKRKIAADNNSVHAAKKGKAKEGETKEVDVDKEPALKTEFITASRLLSLQNQDQEENGETFPTKQEAKAHADNNNAKNSDKKRAENKFLDVDPSLDASTADESRGKKEDGAGEPKKRKNVEGEVAGARDGNEDARHAKKTKVEIDPSTDQNDSSKPPGKKLMVYCCTNHDSFTPIKPASVIVAYDIDHAKRILDEKLINNSLFPSSQHPYFILPLDVTAPKVYMFHYKERDEKELAKASV